MIVTKDLITVKDAGSYFIGGLMADFIAEFHQYMRDNDFEPKGGEVIADGKWHQAKYMKKHDATYILNIKSDGSFANGNCWSRNNEEQRFKWHSKSTEKATPEERKRRKKEYEAQEKERERAEENRQNNISRRITKALSSLERATDQHPYLLRKGIKSHGFLLRKKGNELIIPLTDAQGKIWTVQRILPDGAKYLFAGGKKRGSHYNFPASSRKQDDKDAGSLLLVCEGIATASSIYEATGENIIAAVDSGNLKEVLYQINVEAISKTGSGSVKTRYLICADNDAFTKNSKGEPWNVGLDKAQQAAAEVGGAFVVIPSFSLLSADDYSRTKPTDFNDLHSSFGIDQVAAQIQAAINKIPAPSEPKAPFAPEETASSDQSTSAADQHIGGGDVSLPLKQGDFGMNFKVLGYNNDYYYYFPYNKRQIKSYTAGGHNLNSLMALDTLEAWQHQFAGEMKIQEMVMYATNALMKRAAECGVFKEEAKVRGAGAWLDNKRKVLHCGDVLYVDGALQKFDEMESKFTYIADEHLLRPAERALTNKEAYALREICESVTWEEKLSGSLLAGWLVIAPICGALEFRPHIYIIGEHESGKSTVMDKIIKPVVGDIGVKVDFKTSEPKLREIIGYGSRPVIFDEAEKCESIQDVLGLARLSSTGGVVGKFGQKLFKALSCFCFSAINSPVKTASDESRISFMVIKKNRRPTALQEYDALITKIENNITPHFSDRLIKRTLDNMDTLLKNIATFQRAARMTIHGARASQMLGAMLGGLYLLGSTDLVTLEFAQEWIKKHDWSSHTAIENESDPVRLLQYISGCLLKYNTKDISIGDMIMLVHKDRDSQADRLLRYHGIAVKDGKVNFASTAPHLEKMLRETDWNVKWTRMLDNLPGAEKIKNFYFSVAKKTSGVSIPISYFIEDVAQPELTIQEIPF